VPHRAIRSHGATLENIKGFCSGCVATERASHGPAVTVFVLEM